MSQVPQGTKRDAENKLTELLHQLDTGTFIKPGKSTLAEYLKRWLEEYAKPKLRPRAFERYESITRVHIMPSIGNIPLTQLRPDHLQKHYTAKLNEGLSPRSVRYLHEVLHVALQTAMKWGLLSRNPADAVDPPKAQSRKMQTWNREEVDRFLKGTRGTPYHALFYTALFTGMRRSELLALRWSDLDLTLGVVSINRSLHHSRDGRYVFTDPKSKSSRRTIDLPPSAALLLKEHYEKQKLERMMEGVPSWCSAIQTADPCDPIQSAEPGLYRPGGLGSRSYAFMTPDTLMPPSC